MSSILSTTPAPSSLIVSVEVNPLDLLANRRFKYSHALPKETKAAMGRVADAAFAAASIHDWRPDKDSHYSVELLFSLRGLRGDVDGPVKRTIDGLFQGLRRHHDQAWVNDGRVLRVVAEKRVSDTPSVLATIHLHRSGDVL